MIRLIIPIVAAAAAAGLAAAADAGAPQLTVTAPTHAAKARPVRLVLSLRYEMQCGYPGSPALLVTLPGTVPTRLPPASVLVDGKAATGVSVHARTLTVPMPTRPEVLCDSITTGTLNVVLTTAARIGNPLRAGRYTIRTKKGPLTASAPFVVR